MFDTPSWTWSAVRVMRVCAGRLFAAGVCSRRTNAGTWGTDWAQSEWTVHASLRHCPTFHVFGRWIRKEDDDGHRKSSRERVTTLVISSTVRCTVFLLCSWTRVVPPVWWWSVIWDMIHFLPGKRPVPLRCARRHWRSVTNAPVGATDSPAHASSEALWSRSPVPAPAHQRRMWPSLHSFYSAAPVRRLPTTEHVTTS